jgi:NAD-dependent dihydropyrimidine dehydrogenase PreA subunit
MKDQNFHHGHFHGAHTGEHTGHHGGHERNNGNIACDLTKCSFCGNCQTICMKNAITVDQNQQTWSITQELCVKCGHCVRDCPQNALAFLTSE